MPSVTLTDSALTSVTVPQPGGRTIFNIFPSIDTGVCASSVRRFNKEAAALAGVQVVCVSRDLPFALNRFCAAEGIENIAVLSDFRSDFGEKYGVTMTDGKLAGLLARAIVIVDELGTVIYSEQVPEIGQEPNYEAALTAVKS